MHNLIIAFEKDLKSFKCLEGCEISFQFRRDLVSHLEKFHNILFEVEELKFSSIEDFKLYVQDLQRTQNVEYIKVRGKVLSKDCEHFFLNCSRSGKTTKKPAELKKRISLSSESKKINCNCTSQIKVMVNKSESNVEQVVLARYDKTHYGHEIDIKHIRLPKSERVNIAQRLAGGVNITRVLDDNRENFDEGEVKRMDLLTRKDVHNIKTSFNIEIQNGVRHIQDAVSVDMFVAEYSNSENNPILFYKRQGVGDGKLSAADFCLILMNDSQQQMLQKFGNNIISIDSTHGINAYDFELTTLLVIDEWGEGFPGACMITNRKDSLIFEYFFEKIKDRIGVLHPRVFMSDITTVFYNGWKSIMGTVSSQLFCAWHIDRAWQTNLHKICNADKRKLVYHTLKTLQTISHQGEFHSILAKFLDDLQADKETKSFGDYFRTYYSFNYNQWAYCYRLNAGINTNMRLESMHKILKYFYLDGKKVRRLDKAIFALNKLIRDKVVERIIKCIKGKNSVHIREIHHRHNVAVNCNFEVDFHDEHTWSITSASGEGSYMIKKYISPTQQCCPLRCSLCQICIHSYSCTCSDFFIHSTICKHIHFIAIRYKDKNNCNETFLPNHCEEISNHLKTLATERDNKTHDKHKLQTKILIATQKFQQTASQTENTAVLAHALKSIEKETTFMEIENCNRIFIDERKNWEPANKKIVKQLVFHSTKKKRISRNSKQIKKPTFKEMVDIRNMIKERSLFISHDPSYDHSYC